MHRIRIVLIMLGVLSLGVATVAFAGQDRGDRGSRHGDRDDWRGDRGNWRDDDDGKWWGKRGWRGKFAKATITNAEGDRVGSLWLREDRRDDEVWVMGQVRDLPPGFHGFHIHTTGVCTAPDFTSAGGHFNPTNATHPNHAGDMSTLLVNADGSGTVALVTDRFSIRDLRDDDGSAVIVHELPDNHANIPTRYRSPDSPAAGGPDAATLMTGDAGSRLACGVIR
jgi:superoxide dismutase, Cu-Zn family